jgi:hypothetical protein
MVIDAAGAPAVPTLQLRKASGNMASPGFPAVNSTLGRLDIQGWDSGGSQWRNALSIVVQAQPTAWAAGSFPARVDFNTMAGATPTTRLSIGPQGGIIVGNAVDRGANSLNVTTLYIAGTSLIDWIEDTFPITRH